ncbi:MAG: hypothetical protein ACI837_002690 [Crocinitomicaceae bacterium]|jgi:hypothetical protein
MRMKTKLQKLIVIPQTVIEMKSGGVNTSLWET